MKFDKWSVICVALSLVTLCVMLFIFSNSLKSPSRSNNDSDYFVEHIKPVVDPYNKIKRENFSFAVRKTAHVLEFALLGFCASALFWAVGKKIKGKYYHFPAILVIFTAVVDELLQKISQRTSSIKDVCIDIAGGALGIGVFIVLAVVCHLIFKKISKQST